MDFTYRGYQEFLEKAKEVSCITSFRKSNKQTGVILRHDVDFDLFLAHKLFDIEKQIGVTSTFFIMITSPTYNPFSFNNRRIIRDIETNGFEIGLHVDPYLYPVHALEQAINLEKEILSCMTQTEVELVSFHNYGEHKEKYNLSQYNSVYDGFVTGEFYASDSCMDFRGKDLLQLVKLSKKNIVQLLLHPLHYSVDGDNYVQIFRDHFAREIALTDLEYIDNKTYVKTVGDKNIVYSILKEKT